MEDILFEWEPFNDEDRYAVAVLKGDTVVSHIPAKKDISNLFSVSGSKGRCYNLYAYRRKKIFLTSADEYVYIHYNFQYKILSNVILFCAFKFRIAATHTKLCNNEIFPIYSIHVYTTYGYMYLSTIIPICNLNTNNGKARMLTECYH